MESGSRVGHYRIVSHLGAGGMGEVYLAHDEVLERPVALKILPHGAAPDAISVARLVQEAKSTATLNHPNVAHVYEVGEHAGLPFLAMEYVEGETLDKATGGKPLPVSEVTEIARQVADALEMAHAKGIIHRDIKPSNLIRTARGQVKVLDFGLAKLSQRANRKLVPALATTGRPFESTLSGHAIGSIPYMSPEQAMAKELDERTDIFSLGAVLYELATGRRAFGGVTAALVFDAILNRTPPAPRTVNPQVSEPLDRVIRKCLEKDPRLRYQTASDLVADLRLIQRDRAIVHEVEGRQRDRRWMALALVLAVAGIAATAWTVAKKRSEFDVVKLQTVPLTTFPGSESHPSFSPDGTQVAFSWNQGKEDDLDLFVTVVGAGTPLQLTKTPETEYSPAWSPDGQHIAFLRQSTDKAGFFLIPALGGVERKISDASPHRVGGDSPFVAWSPDAKTLAIVDRLVETDPLSIYLVDVASGQRRRLTAPPEKTVGDSALAWSPDGNSIAFIRTAGIAVQDIHIVDLTSGHVRRMTNENRRVFGLTWNANDGKLLFSSGREPGTRLWRLSPKDGSLERVIGLGDGAGFLAYSAKANRLAYTRSSIDPNIWLYQMPSQGTPEPTGHVLSASTRLEQGPRFSPDGKRVAFASNRSGAQEIWVTNTDGTGATQLTTAGWAATGSPMWSPDGKWLVFDSRPEGNPDVYIISADGGSPRRLTQDASEEVTPSWSRDGKWIYYSSNRTGRWEVWRSPVPGGDAEKVTSNGGFFGVESPDGKWLYYVKALNRAGLWRMPVAGGTEDEILPSLRTGYANYWCFGRTGLNYVDREERKGGGARYALHHFDPATKKDAVITYLARRPFSGGLSVSPDGRQFLYTQVDTSETEILMVEGFR